MTDKKITVRKQPARTLGASYVIRQEWQGGVQSLYFTPEQFHELHDDIHDALGLQRTDVKPGELGALSKIFGGNIERVFGDNIDQEEQ